jgi:hypothetical protein
LFDEDGLRGQGYDHSQQRHDPFEDPQDGSSAGGRYGASDDPYEAIRKVRFPLSPFPLSLKHSPFLPHSFSCFFRLSQTQSLTPSSTHSRWKPLALATELLPSPSSQLLIPLPRSYSPFTAPQLHLLLLCPFLQLPTTAVRSQDRRARTLPFDVVSC